MQISIRRAIPNFFTFASLFCGFYSISASADLDFRFAAWLIVFAAICDALDGMSARLLNSGSNFGVELDSLADVVSFGAAPGFLIYKSVLYKYDLSGLFVASLLLVAGAYRLARFNSELTGFDKKSFSGLPIPSAAITIASFIFLAEQNGIILEKFSIYAIPLVLLLSALMVSRIEYETIPKISVEGVKDKPFHFFFLLAGLLMTIFMGSYIVFYFFLLVILFGIFRYLYFLFFVPKDNSEFSGR